MCLVVHFAIIHVLARIFWILLFVIPTARVLVQTFANANPTLLGPIAASWLALVLRNPIPRAVTAEVLAKVPIFALAMTAPIMLEIIANILFVTVETAAMRKFVVATVHVHHRKLCTITTSHTLFWEITSLGPTFICNTMIGILLPCTIQFLVPIMVFCGPMIDMVCVIYFCMLIFIDETFVICFAYAYIFF